MARSNQFVAGFELEPTMAQSAEFEREDHEVPDDHLEDEMEIRIRRAPPPPEEFDHDFIPEPIDDSTNNIAIEQEVPSGEEREQEASIATGDVNSWQNISPDEDGESEEEGESDEEEESEDKEEVDHDPIPQPHRPLPYSLEIFQRPEISYNFHFQDIVYYPYHS